MSKHEVEKIAKLARLYLTDEQKIKIATQFDHIKDYFATLAKLEIDTQIDTDGIDYNDLRIDEAVKSNIDISFSPYQENSLFKVPKVIE